MEPTTTDMSPPQLLGLELDWMPSCYHQATITHALCFQTTLYLAGEVMNSVKLGMEKSMVILVYQHHTLH